MEAGGAAMGVTRVLALLFHDVYRRTSAESGFSDLGAEHYKLALPAFERQLASLARVRAERPVLMPVARADAPAAVPFTITVDDGGVSFHSMVADRLEALDWRAHCFVTTAYIDRPCFLGSAQIRELRRRGHVIGTHSVSHPRRFSACGRAQMLREWSESRKALADVLGEDVTIGSVPGGYFSALVAETAAEAGLSVLFTSEPEIRVRTIGGCVVVGRFTVRSGAGDDFAARLGSLDRRLRASEWLLWNAKKTARTVLGTAYPRLAARWVSNSDGKRP
jgi:peptidoglycan/xylan/chitin deacetylase (PgdA/CDA1 family)